MGCTGWVREQVSAHPATASSGCRVGCLPRHRLGFDSRARWFFQSVRGRAFLRSRSSSEAEARDGWANPLGTNAVAYSTGLT